MTLVIPDSGKPDLNHQPGIFIQHARSFLISIFGGLHSKQVLHIETVFFEGALLLMPEIDYEEVLCDL
jgi:hypothetical protein